MHYWGDEWFEKYGDELYTAINEIERGLRKYHIGVCGKEKYGTYRDDFLTFWDGTIYKALFGYRAHIGTFHTKGLYRYKWFVNFIDKIHHYIYFRIDLGIPQKLDKKKEDGSPFYSVHESAEILAKHWWPGMRTINRKLGLTGLVQKRMARNLNKVFQEVCAKHPDIVDELICDVDCYELIKPCKWGNIDGIAIHKKYWKSL